MESDMMSKMPTEELQKMFEMASSLRGTDPVSMAAALQSNGIRSDTRSVPIGARESFASRGDHAGESSSSPRSDSQSGLPNLNVNLQEQMKNKMKDPAMRQMFASMVKNMSPNMMATMSKQFGFKPSRKEAEKAQQAMSSLSPDDLDGMRQWADRIWRGVGVERKTEELTIGETGMVLAIFMLILAIVLHWLGYIGR